VKTVGAIVDWFVDLILWLRGKPDKIVRLEIIATRPQAK
jgi:hypothetical protein